MTMFQAMLRQMDAMAEALEELDFSKNPELVFRETLHDALLKDGVDAHTGAMVVEHMQVTISANSDLDEVRVLATRYADVIAKVVRSRQFIELRPVLQRAVLRGMTFKYES